MEGVDRFQRANGHVPCLQLFVKLRDNELHLLIGEDVSTIANVRLFLLLIHSSWKGDRDVVLCCCMAE